jgi:hypothetical protein
VRGLCEDCDRNKFGIRSQSHTLLCGIVVIVAPEEVGHRIGVDQGEHVRDEEAGN